MFVSSCKFDFRKEDGRSGDPLQPFFLQEGTRPT